MAEDFKADVNESHDNSEALEGIADGGLASFVKSSTMDDDDDYCKYQVDCRINAIEEDEISDRPNKDSKIKREHSASGKKLSSSK